MSKIINTTFNVSTGEVTTNEIDDNVIYHPLQDVVKTMESAIENHINEVVKSRGYNNQDSIAKYLVAGNPFYTECTAISLWIGNVWVYAHQVQADVVAGSREMPTSAELIAELPVLVVS